MHCIEGTPQSDENLRSRYFVEGTTDHLTELIPHQPLAWLAHTGKPQARPETSSLLDDYWSRIESLKDSIRFLTNYIIHILNKHTTTPLYLKFDFIKSTSANKMATFICFMYLSAWGCFREWKFSHTLKTIELETEKAVFCCCLLVFFFS